MVFDVGRVCMKIAGRDAGNLCVVVDAVDDKYVIVTGPKSLTGVRRKKVNKAHLDPKNKKLDIQKGADDKAVEAAMKSAGLVK